MQTASRHRSLLAVLILLAIAFNTAQAASYRYFRVGNKVDVQTKASAGIALMGGGKDLDAAFEWLCNQGNHGDFLVLRATGNDDYNSYINGLCKMNSVATLILSDRQSAQDPRVAEIIRNATVVFIAGGDQSNYIRGWQDTPVQDALNANVALGKPIGGTSAGLAVLGEFVYASLEDQPDGPDLASTDVLPNPYFDRVTLVRNFLKVPGLNNLLTDSHFAKRDRMGRSLVFLARIMQDGWSLHPREVAIDEKSAVLVDADGQATVVGSGKGAYFLHPTEPPETCKESTPLTFKNIDVYRVSTGGHFDFLSWKGDGGVAYRLSVDAGKIHSTQPNGSVY